MIEDSHPVVSPNACRLYFKCTFSRERSCAAKKQVQQRDAGEPPMFLVTYLNEHTCQQPQAVPGTPNTAGSSPTTTSRQRQSSSSPPAEMLDLTMNGAGLFSRLLLPHAVGGGGSAAEEEAAIVTCLAAVISGGGAAAAPPPLIWPTSAPEAAFVASAADTRRAPRTRAWRTRRRRRRWPTWTTVSASTISQRSGRQQQRITVC